MPEMRQYTVTQERQIKVDAVSPLAAALVAQAFFDSNETQPLTEGRATSEVRARTLEVREDY